MNLKTLKQAPALLCTICFISGPLAHASADEPMLGSAGQSDSAKEKGFLTFSPPQGWRMADQKDLPKSVKLMVVGQGSYTFPPSINLGTEKFQGTLREYLGMIKEINNAQGAEWKDLGTIKTMAGNASLSQVDSKTEWGDVRMMHAVMVRDGNAYILTCAALKEEFSKFYKDFFSSMRSLNFTNDPIRTLTGKEQREEMISLREDLQKSFKQLADKNQIDLRKKEQALKLFESPEFQQTVWDPFKEKLKKDFAEYGTEWQNELLLYVREDLTQKN